MAGFDTGRRMPLNLPNVSSAVWDPTGKLVAAIDEQGVIKVWQTTGEEHQVIGRRANGWRPFLFSPDSKKLALIRERPGSTQVELWDLGADKPPITIAVTSRRPLGTPAFSADARLMACCCEEEKTIQIYWVQTGQQFARLAFPADAYGGASIALSPDGTRVAWVGLRPRHVTTVFVLDGTTGGVVRLLLGPTSNTVVSRLAFTPDQRFILAQARVPNRDGNGIGWAGILLWEIATSQLVAWLPGHAFADGFDPHGQIVVARLRETGGDHRLELDCWSSSEVSASLARAGLGACMRAGLPSEKDRSFYVRDVEPDGAIVQRFGYHGTFLDFSLGIILGAEIGIGIRSLLASFIKRKGLPIPSRRIPPALYLAKALMGAGYLVLAFVYWFDALNYSAWLIFDPGFTPAWAKYKLSAAVVLWCLLTSRGITYLWRAPGQYHSAVYAA